MSLIAAAKWRPSEGRGKGRQGVEQWRGGDVMTRAEAAPSFLRPAVKSADAEPRLAHGELYSQWQ